MTISATHIRVAVVAVAAFLAATFTADAQRYNNDKLLNRPYADNRAWHLGFSVGLHAQDVHFTHNGYVGPGGEMWYVEQPGYSPGFNVNGLVSLRLNDWFSVRFTPGMFFGNREVTMLDNALGTRAKQNIKSAHVVLPLELKYAAMRWRNARPYIIGGVMPTVDVAKRRNDYLKFRPFDTFLTIGFGTDFYLPYFKLIPELKFCIGLTDILVRKRADLVEEPDKLLITQSLTKATSKMVVLTFYFE